MLATMLATMPASMLALDTNVLLRLLVGDDAAQARAAEKRVSAGAWVSHLVLAETFWVLSSVYERTNAQLAAAIELLLQHEHLLIQDPHVVRAALTHFQKKPKLGFSDCLVLEIARHAGHLPLISFDKALGKLAGVAPV